MPSFVLSSSPRPGPPPSVAHEGEGDTEYWAGVALTEGIIQEYWDELNTP